MIDLTEEEFTDFKQSWEKMKSSPNDKSTCIKVWNIILEFAERYEIRVNLYRLNESESSAIYDLVFEAGQKAFKDDSTSPCSEAIKEAMEHVYERSIQEHSKLEIFDFISHVTIGSTKSSYMPLLLKAIKTCKDTTCRENLIKALQAALPPSTVPSYARDSFDLISEKPQTEQLEVEFADY